jgi:hypothetical protein
MIFQLNQKGISRLIIEKQKSAKIGDDRTREKNTIYTIIIIKIDIATHIDNEKIVLQDISLNKKNFNCQSLFRVDKIFLLFF